MIRRRARAAARADRTYSVADFVLFERYRDARSEHAPAECNSPRPPLVVARRPAGTGC